MSFKDVLLIQVQASFLNPDRHTSHDNALLGGSGVLRWRLRPLPIEVLLQVFDRRFRVIQDLHDLFVLLVGLEFVLKHIGGVHILENAFEPHIPDSIKKPIPDDQFPFLLNDRVLLVLLWHVGQRPLPRSILLQVLLQKVVLAVLYQPIDILEHLRSNIYLQWGHLNVHMNFLFRC